MGTCISTKESNIEASKSVKETVKSNTGLNSKQTSQIIIKPIIEKFKDMPELEDKFVGEGIRRMKAYKCDLKIDQLQKLQEEFWGKIGIFKLKLRKFQGIKLFGNQLNKYVK